MQTRFQYRYRTEERTVSLPVADYVARFRDTERFEACCRACPAYGRSWACPPFDSDMEACLSGYETALLVAVKIFPEEPSLPLGESLRLIRPERMRHERQLLMLERRHGGRAFAYAGTCLHCPEGTCTRPSGEACRHPELVRPSLEACGFDLGRTVSELFGFELLWSRNGLIPQYLTLVSGFFHNAGSVEWDTAGEVQG